MSTFTIIEAVSGTENEVDVESFDSFLGLDFSRRGQDGLRKSWLLNLKPSDARKLAAELVARADEVDARKLVLTVEVSRGNEAEVRAALAGRATVVASTEKRS